MSFTARKTAPSSSDKHWIHTSAGGYNDCIKVSGNSCIPNCVGYAYGRFYEILGKKPSLCRSNAENWYGYNDGYSRGKTPKLGAVICWSKGKVGNSSDGAGHVAIVEEIYSDGSILTSNSGYNSTRFYMKKIPKGYALSGYSFQGFIYNPAVTSSSSKTMKCVAKSGLKIRSGAGTGYKQVGSIKYGATVTVTGSTKDSSGNIWYKVSGGYTCGKQGSNVYLK